MTMMARITPRAAPLSPPSARGPELEFLPALLELRETPPPAAARWLLRAILAGFAAAVLWACVGRLDVVAVARGKVVPSDRVQVVQPFERGVVAAIHVADGDRVATGEALIELDATAVRAEQARLERERDDRMLDAARLEALLAALRTGRPPALASPPGAGAETLRLAEARMQREWHELTAALAGLDRDVDGNRAERRAAERRIERLDALLPLIAERAAALGELAASRLGARADWLVVEEQRIERAKAREVERAGLAVLDSAHAALLERRRALVAGTEARWMQELARVQGELAAGAQALAQVAHRIGLHVLRAPVAGTVERLAVHTVGGVVTPAQVLLAVVPEDDALEIEALIANNDAGFVRTGQRAVVKVDAFPFTRYGTLEGEVRSLAADALADERLGLVYPARIALAATTLADGTGPPRRLAAGMAVTVDVHLGERRVIELLLGPLLEHLREAGREP